MRLRVIVPILLALAVVGGLLLGRPTGGDAVTPSAADGAQPAGSSSSSSGASPSASQGGDPGANNGSVANANVPQPAFEVTKLKPGQKPPQFVIVSFDGACKDALFKHYLDLAEKNGAHFTYNLSGLCIVPDAKRFTYKPPNHPAGSSAIGFGEASLIPGRIANMTTAYNRGDEIASHALGHFCGANGVGQWNSADWTSELKQFNSYLDNWSTVLGPPLNQGVAPLPFNSSVIKGIRTPCLEGKRSQMYPVWVKFGYTYDASNPGSLEWPKKNSYGLWEFPLQTIKIVGYRPNLSMDYNLMCAQNKCSNKADAATAAKIQASTLASYDNALKAVCTGNRAPFFVGNHFNTWVRSAYLNSLTDFVNNAKSVCPDVQFVSNVDLVKWLEAQDPAVLKALRHKGVQTY